MGDKTRKLRCTAAWLLLIVTLTGSGAGAATLKVITQDIAPDTCFKGTREDVVSMVTQAVQLVSEKGSEFAFRQFMRSMPQAHGIDRYKFCGMLRIINNNIQEVI